MGHSVKWALRKKGCEPWLRVILRKFFLMLGNDICILVEYDESYRSATVFRLVTSLGNGRITHVVPQSRDPTNSPCFKLAIGRTIVAARYT